MSDFSARSHPQRFATTGIHQLRAEFAARKCRLVRSTAARIIARAENTVTPHPAATAGE